MCGALSSRKNARILNNWKIEVENDFNFHVQRPFRPIEEWTMEYSLHQQLKELYGTEDAEFEVKLGRYRIDAVLDGLLIEVQQSSLSAIGDKIQKLCEDHKVLVVKPLVARKTIVKLDQKDGTVVSRRKSPKKGTGFTLFEELVYFTRAFPHPNLTLETPLIEMEEIRYPGNGRRRRRRKNSFQIQDMNLLKIVDTLSYQKADDLWQLIPSGMSKVFDTAVLAKHLDVSKWDAQRIAYCLRETGAVKTVGKNGNAILYERSSKRRKPSKTRKKVVVKKGDVERLAAKSVRRKKAS